MLHRPKMKEPEVTHKASLSSHSHETQTGQQGFAKSS